MSRMSTLSSPTACATSQANPQGIRFTSSLAVQLADLAEQLAARNDEVLVQDPTDRRRLSPIEDELFHLAHMVDALCTRQVTR